MALKINLQTKEYTLTEIKSLAEEALTYLDVKIATELELVIEKLLVKSGLDKNTLEWLKMVTVQLKFVRFTALSEAELETLLLENLTACYDIPDFNLKERIGKRLIFLGEIEAQMGFIEKLIKIFSQSKSRLGKQSIIAEEKIYDQTIGNWIKIYLNQPAKSAQRTNLEEWAFVQQNPAAKYLTQEEKNILLDILRIFDSLRNRISNYQALPESNDENEVFPNFDEYVALPGLTINFSEQNWKQKNQKILDPSTEESEEESQVITEEADQKNLKILEPESLKIDLSEDDKQTENQKDLIQERTKVNNSDQTNNLPRQKTNQPLVKPVNIQDILHKGQSGDFGGSGLRFGKNENDQFSSSSGANLNSLSKIQKSSSTQSTQAKPFMLGKQSDLSLTEKKMPTIPPMVPKKISSNPAKVDVASKLPSALKASNQVNIDEKLEELRKKVKKK